MNSQFSLPSLTEFLNDDTESLSLFTESKYYSISDLETMPNLANRNKTITVFNSNARSLLKHECEYKSLFDSISKTGMHFDIISFCETWLDVNLESLISFDDYTAIYRHKHNGKKVEGLLLSWTVG